MNRRLPLYIIIAAGGFILLVLYYSNRLPFGRKNTSFAVKPGTEITGIDLIKGGDKVTLRLRGGSWYADKNIEARKQAVLPLVQILQGMKIKSPVSAEIFIRETAEKGEEPVRVNVFSKRRVVKTFYVYRTGSNAWGNVMKMRPGSKPFIVFVPGNEENIGQYFNADYRYWQPYSVFRILPSEIRRVEMQDLNSPGSSFVINNVNGRLSVSDSSGQLAGTDSLRIRRYLSYFVSVSFESIASEAGDSLIREVLSSPPSFRIIVGRAGGEADSLTVWEKRKTVSGVSMKDTDRAWAKKNDGKGLFIIRYFDLDPLLKKKSYFTGG